MCEFIFEMKKSFGTRRVSKPGSSVCLTDALSNTPWSLHALKDQKSIVFELRLKAMHGVVLLRKKLAAAAVVVAEHTYRTYVQLLSFRSDFSASQLSLKRSIPYVLARFAIMIIIPI